jgi:hypothetical protein
LRLLGWHLRRRANGRRAVRARNVVRQKAPPPLRRGQSRRASLSPSSSAPGVRSGRNLPPGNSTVSPVLPRC